MGLIYVNPEGPEGKPDPLAAAQGHPRDVRPHGDERRGDGRADRRRPHGRQDPRRRRRRPGRTRARGRPDRAAGPGLEVRVRQRQGRRHHHQWPRGGVDEHPDQVGQQLPGDPVRLRMGADQEPGRCLAVRSPRTAQGGTIPDPFGGPGRASRRCWSPTSRCGWTRSTARSPGAGWTIPRSWTRRSPRPGTSCCTATWDRSPATWARGSPSRSCGRTRCPRSITS